ncbi:hypothetical protein BDW22DRAFT_1484753 [Trametopsis cervina]|nr:hypothetical protein BDW22DRAFT_1484753 [Trametopsis cervina]
MSARQPFMPQLKQDTSANDSSSDSLKADTSMSSDGDGNRTSSTSLSLHSMNSDDTSISSGINKPLNISSLMKNKPHTSANASSLKTRASIETEAKRPFSPSTKPFHPAINPRGARIAAPSPFFPSTASFQSISAFRTPRIPSPTKLHSAASVEDLNMNQPHTSDSVPLPVPHSEEHSYNIQRGSPYERSRSAASGKDQPGDRQRERSGGLEDFNPGENGLGAHYRAPFLNPDRADHEQDRYTKMPPRRVLKRVERVDDKDNNGDYGNPKRYKLDDDDDVPSACDSHGNLLTSYPFSPQRSPSPAVSHAGSLYASSGQPPAPIPDVRKNHAIARLLGQDLDSYVSTHQDIYEDAKKKWTECTIEEWKTGADELAGRFSHLLDYVKDHMNTKLSLYASFADNLSAHRTVLQERESTLEDVRRTLIRNGGNVCGNANITDGIGATRAIDLDSGDK